AVTARLLRFPMMVLAGSLGLFGVMVGVLAILIHAAGLRSFGMPYLAPLAPLKPADWKDVVVRAPVWALRARPSQLAPANRYRVARGSKPYPGRTGPGGMGR
ncbi:MAG: spore germination protein, partial [Firmicutes bacterium]|nr:spore germination protein [Bacillota bacterium]